MGKTHVRSIFISDTHLGCSYARTKLLLDFLDEYKTERLYLVGDIIDGWKLSKSFYWNIEASSLIRKVIGMMKKGTVVTYIPGNHDEFLRDYTPIEMDNLFIADEAIHLGVDDKKYLVIHGDIFDNLTRHLSYLYHIGDIGYDILLFVNKWTNIIRRKLNLRYWSLSKLCKAKVKQAVNYINNFEHHLVHYAHQKSCEGVITGHIHSPCVKQLDGLMYYNCGDWIDSCSAIIEHHGGQMELIHVLVGH